MAGSTGVQTGARGLWSSTFSHDNRHAPHGGHNLALLLQPLLPLLVHQPGKGESHDDQLSSVLSRGCCC